MKHISNNYGMKIIVDTKTYNGILQAKKQGFIYVNIKDTSNQIHTVITNRVN